MQIWLRRKRGPERFSFPRQILIEQGPSCACNSSKNANSQTLFGRSKNIYISTLSKVSLRVPPTDMSLSSRAWALNDSRRRSSVPWPPCLPMEPPLWRGSSARGINTAPYTSTSLFLSRLFVPGHAADTDLYWPLQSNLKRTWTNEFSNGPWQVLRKRDVHVV